MGWTPDPPEPRPSRAHATGGVFTAIAAAIGVIGAGFAVAALLFVLAVSAMFSGCNSGSINLGGQDRYRPTPQEVQQAATTSTIPAAGCQQFKRVLAATTKVADATRFADPSIRHPKAEALASLNSFTRTAQDAMPYSKAAMGKRLSAAIALAERAKAIIAGIKGHDANVNIDAFDIPDDQPGAKESDSLYDVLDAGYTELRIAEVLLGRACGGRLAPAALRVMLGPDGSRYFECLEAQSASTTAPHGSGTTGTTISCPLPTTAP